MSIFNLNALILLYVFIVYFLYFRDSFEMLPSSLEYICQGFRFSLF